MEQRQSLPEGSDDGAQPLGEITIYVNGQGLTVLPGPDDKRLCLPILILTPGRQTFSQPIQRCQQVVEMGQEALSEGGHIGAAKRLK
jgi:hypothetical protein